jgi:predicted nucleic acid-binding protein
LKTPPLSLVLDTNCVLDLLLFQDANCQPIAHWLGSHQAQILVTSAMLEELRRVLTYADFALSAAQQQSIWARYVAMSVLLTPAEMPPLPPSLPRCRDPDDQGFIDLAAALAATAPGAPTKPGSVLLISRDKAVLRLRRALQRVVVTLLAPAELDAYWLAYQTLRQHSATISP